MEKTEKEKNKNRRIWNWLFWKKRDREEKEEPEQIINIEQREEPIRTQEEINEALVEQRSRLQAEVDELQEEYHWLTTYLSDIQKIEQLPQENKEELEWIVSKLVNKQKECEIYQKNTKRLPRKHVEIFERYEERMEEEIRGMYEREKYHQSILHDLHTLEQEKTRCILLQEKEQKYLGKLENIAKGVMAFVVASLAIFLGLYYWKTYINVGLYLSTVTIAVVATSFVLVKSHKSKEKFASLERTKKRVIMLLNQVKLQMVHSVSGLEYTCRKFQVKSLSELQKKWQEYQLEKKSMEEYEKSCKKLEYYHKELIGQLKNYQIAEVERWVHQCLAIIDEREMVEVKHKLFTERQKIREQIEQKKELMEEYRVTIEEYKKWNKVS